MKEVNSTSTSSDAPLEHVVTPKGNEPETHQETHRTETHHEHVPAKDVEVKEETIKKD